VIINYDERVRLVQRCSNVGYMIAIALSNRYTIHVLPEKVATRLKM